MLTVSLKRWLSSTALVALFLFANAAFAGTMHMKNLGDTEIQPSLAYLLSDSLAVGQIELINTAGRPLLQSGFFIDETHFMTALTPAEKTLKCSGAFVRVGDLYLKPNSKKIACKKLVEANWEFGYAIIETAEAWPHSLQVLPTSEELSLKRYPVYHTLGFGPIGHAFATEHCMASRGKCTNCEKHSVDTYAWSDASCLFFRSMLGAPMISRANGAPRVVGILTDFSNASGSLAIFARPKVVSIDAIRLKSPILSAVTEPAPDCQLLADPSVMEMGETTTVKLVTEGVVTNYTINGETMTELGGKRTLAVRLLKSTGISATVEGPGGKRSCSVGIKVIPIPAPTCELMASKKSIKYGESVDLTIKPSGRFDSFIINGIESATLQTPFVLKVSPERSQMFLAHIKGIGGTTSCAVPVQVEPLKAISCTISPSVRRVELGDPITFDIVANTTKLDLVTVAGRVLKANRSGKYNVTMMPKLGDTSVSARIKLGSQVAACHTTIQVDPVPPPTCQLKASQSTINLGQSINLTITTGGKTTTHSINGVAKASLSGGNTLRVIPDTSRRYLAQVEGPGGQGHCYADVVVKKPIPTCSLRVSPTKVSPGAQVVATISINGSAKGYTIDGVRNLSGRSHRFTAGEASRTVVAKVWNDHGTSICRAQLVVEP